MPMPLPEIGKQGWMVFLEVTSLSAISCGTPINGRLAFVKGFITLLAHTEMTPGWVRAAASCAALRSVITIGSDRSAKPFVTPTDCRLVDSIAPGWRL